MKKLLYLFCASLLAFTSCSKDDDNNSSDPATSTLPKKIVSVYSSGTYTSTFTYNGNKIVSKAESDGSKTNYTYTGDVITKTEELDEKGFIETTTEYTYIGGKLAVSLEKEVDEDYDTKTVYTYNTDGTVSYADFLMNKTTGALVDDGATVGTYTFNAGNLVKNVYEYYGSKYTVTLEYDSKNNPLKNITGFSLLLDNEGEVSVNNMIKRTFSSSNHTNNSTNTYTYNENGFPIEQKSFIDETSDGTYTFVY